MPIHFAAARCASRSPVARALARKAVRRAANDNPGGAGECPAEARVLSAALRHFAEHGVSAAQEAAELAERAWQQGDCDGYLWWAEICHKLDRKRAHELTRMRIESVGGVTLSLLRTNRKDS
jgi:hypothetical protein